MKFSSVLIAFVPEFCTN